MRILTKFKFVTTFKRFYAAAAATSFSISALYIMNENNNHLAKAEDLDLSEALTNTITNEKTLIENSSSMRTKMEVYVTNLQGRIIKEFQKLEPDSKFTVDKWNREEVIKYLTFHSINLIKKHYN